MINDISNKKVFITGGSDGIGKAIAISLYNLNCNVAICGRSLNKLEKMKEQYPKMHIIQCDLTNDNDVNVLIDKVYNILDGLDILINNAGIVLNDNVENTSNEDFDNIYNTNVRAPFILCKNSIKYLKQSTYAMIINIGSVVSHKGYVNQCAYAASKHALYGFTKVLANELYQDDIRVHIICPGGVYTDMVAKIRPDLDSSRLIVPENISDIIEFLITHRGSAIIDEINIHRIDKEPF